VLSFRFFLLGQCDVIMHELCIYSPLPKQKDSPLLLAICNWWPNSFTKATKNQNKLHKQQNKLINKKIS
jgi:hypothetical protein